MLQQLVRRSCCLQSFHQSRCVEEITSVIETKVLPGGRMSLYLFLILPALTAALWSDRLSKQQLAVVWAATSLLMVWLIPIGSRDYPTYLRDFADFNELAFSEVVRQDPLYASAVWLFGHLGGTAEVFYLLLGSAGLWIKLTALQRLSAGSSMVVLLYICSYFFLHDFTQLRAGLAIGIWMHALADLRYSPGRYLLLTALASLIHLQAALGFVLFGFLLLSRSRVGVWLLSIGALLIVAVAATPIFDQLGYAMLAAIPDPRTDVYLDLAAQDFWVHPNPYSFLSLLALATALSGLHLSQSVSLQRRKPESELDVSRAVFVALLLGTCSLSVLSSVSVAAFRVSENFFALLPLGVWMAASRDGAEPRHTGPLWLLAAVFAYIFLFYSPYLFDPTIDVLNE